MKENGQITTLNTSFLWTIKNFNKYNCQSCFTSPFLTISGRPELRLFLYIFPMTGNRQTNSYMKIKFVDYYKFNLRIVCSIINRYNKKTEIFGNRLHSFEMQIPDFINVNQAKKFENNLMVDGEIRILCEIETTEPNLNELYRECASEYQLSRDMEFGFCNKKFSDFVIVDSTGKQIYVHKLVLAARSTVFAKMFEHGTKEQKEGSVLIPNIEYKCLKEMLRFIYTGKVQDLQKLAPDLLGAADQYALQDLKEICETTIFSAITVENAVAAFVIADRHSSTILKSNVLNFILNNSKDVISTAGFKALEGSQIYLVKEFLCAIVDYKDKSKRSVSSTSDSSSLSSSDLSESQSQSESE